MTSLQQTRVETIACIAAMLLIPLYMRLVHMPPADAVADAGVGGVAMAVGEELQFNPSPHDVSQADRRLLSALTGRTGGIACALILV